jgi:hypothetical protein
MCAIALGIIETKETILHPNQHVIFGDIFHTVDS